MAKAWITSYSHLARDANGQELQIPDEDSRIETVVVDFTGGATAMAAAFDSRARFAIVVTDTHGHMVKTKDGTAATVSNRLIPSYTPTAFGVRGGKLSFIAAA